MATNTDSVRLLIPDTNLVSPIFTDAQILTFLALSSDRVFLAAAMALETVASDETLVYKIVTTDDLSVNGVTGAQVLLNRAKQLRADQAEATLAATPGDAFQLIFPTSWADAAPLSKAEASAWPL